MGKTIAFCALALCPSISLAQGSPPPIIHTEPMPKKYAPVPPAEKYGDWLIEYQKTYVGAYTPNESGSTFGILCGKQCVAYVSSGTPCQDGASYPALVNSSLASFSINFRCAIVDSTYAYVLDDTSNLVSAMEKGGQIGFAFPLQSGKFAVQRYSLNGSIVAAARVVQIAKKFREDSGKDLKDFSL